MRTFSDNMRAFVDKLGENLYRTRWIFLALVVFWIAEIVWRATR